MSFQALNAWTVIAWVIAASWIAITIAFALGFRKRSSLRPMTDRADSSETPRLTVIVPARNESTCIETCIRSLLQQDYPKLQLIAVNDRSSDDTGAILDRLSTEFDGRLLVLHVATLPSDWFGKPHALQLGLKNATGTVVCFTDADCEFESPLAFHTAVAELTRRRLDFLSITAQYTMTSLLEQVAVPCCSELLLTWLRPERVEDPRWPDAFANGAFILVRRESFELIGGWESVRTKISEDLELARVVKRAGLRLAVAQGDGFYQTRSYATTRDSWNGWSRILKGTLTPAQLLITVGRMLVLFVLPLAAMLWGLSDAWRTGSFAWLTSATGLGFAVAFGLRCALDVAMFRLVGSPVAAALLAPLGRLFVMAAALRALFSHAGLVHTHWRGTSFCRGQVVTPPLAQPELQIPATRAAPVSVPRATAFARSVRSAAEILAPDPMDAARRTAELAYETDVESHPIDNRLGTANGSAKRPRSNSTTPDSALLT